MFEVGKKYEFRIIEGGDEIVFWGTIESYEHPLLKLQDTRAMKSEVIREESSMSISFVEDPEGKVYRGRIINVISPNFISAVQE
ncbi:hypothetical protein HA459_18710 [Rhizobium leguminosarum bv. trifolii]|uniref:hypothetical protein n=1 Tax=Rhizobium leguminosarum TaxID=384 RepID=UPI00140FBA70|nr:hypothetical protein [Rhizobium leguminosarum]QIO73934.1 hypothetical protein HA459_18710 [Rhizobium leguminosarum bv. trifolii]QIO80953.1 hypothetical protein HA460_18750 [Rhizobium leguminosarum bv. trifolii]